MLHRNNIYFILEFTTIIKSITNYNPANTSVNQTFEKSVFVPLRVPEVPFTGDRTVINMLTTVFLLKFLLNSNYLVNLSETRLKIFIRAVGFKKKTSNLNCSNFLRGCLA